MMAASSSSSVLISTGSSEGLCRRPHLCCRHHHHRHYFHHIIQGRSTRQPHHRLVWRQGLHAVVHKGLPKQWGISERSSNQPANASGKRQSGPREAVDYVPSVNVEEVLEALAISSGAKCQFLKIPEIMDLSLSSWVWTYYQNSMRPCFLNSTDWLLIMSCELRVSDMPYLAGKLLRQNVTS